MVSCSSANDAPAGYYTEACDGGGAVDVCSWSENGGNGTLSCYGSQLNGGGERVGMWAVQDFDGNAGTDVFSVWGVNDSLDKFCCVLDDVDDLLDLVLLGGTDYDDKLKFLSGTNQLGAHASRDLVGQIIGNGGDDTIWGSKSTNSYYQDNIRGDDVAELLSGEDTIVGYAGDDIIRGGPGIDNISGNQGLDTIYGGAGSDEIDGGSGDDTLYGDDGHDTILGGSGDDILDGGDGDDKIQGNAGTDALYGGDGDDVLCDDAEEDFFEGSPAGVSGTKNTLWYGIGDLNVGPDSLSDAGDSSSVEHICGENATWGLWATHCGTSAYINTIPTSCPAW